MEENVNKKHDSAPCKVDKMPDVTWSREPGWGALLFICISRTVAFRRATDCYEKVWVPFCTMLCLKSSLQLISDENSPGLEALLAENMHSHRIEAGLVL